MLRPVIILIITSILCQIGAVGQKHILHRKIHDNYISDHINFDVLEIWDNPKIRPITEVKIWVERKNEIIPPDFNAFYKKIITEKPVTKFFDSGIEENNEFLPVIYQPRIDAWKNFLRDIHIHPLKDRNEYEITLIFEDEKLRAHGPLDFIYRFIRIILHKRINDIHNVNYNARHSRCLCDLCWRGCRCYYDIK